MGNIVSFPTPYPDEDYRSIVHRYHLRSPYNSYIQSRKELFGKILKNTMFPVNLSRLVDQLGVQSEFCLQLLQNHTFYPLFRPFLSVELNSEYISKMMCSSKESSKPALLDKNGSRGLISEHLWYCPHCLEYDYHTFGESYVHRIHQLSFLNVCPVHRVQLLNRCLTCRKPFSNDVASIMLIEPRCYCGNRIESFGEPVQIDSFILNLLVDLQYLMSNEFVTSDTVHQRLITLTGCRGYIHFRGDFIYKKKLLTDFVEFYGEDKLSCLGVTLNEILGEKFMVKFLEEDYLRTNIVLYVLLMRFLAGSAESFFNNNESYAVALPFGHGPWACVNPICPYHNKKIITRCRRKAHEWVTGIFTCSECGMIYTRKGLPKEEDESLFSIDTQGFLFINTALQYYQNGYLIQEIAELLHSNKTTVSKYLRPFRVDVRAGTKSIDLETARKAIELGFHEAAATSTPKIETCKETIIEAIEVLGKDATRPEIRKYNIHRYDWVMKNEPSWMEEMLPPKKKLPKILNQDTLDNELYSLVADAVQKVWKAPPDYRITKEEIYRRLPGYVKSRVLKFSDMLPKTIQLIEESLESQDQFLVRKFPKMINWFMESRYHRCTLKLLQSKFTALKYCSEEVKEWMSEQIKGITKNTRTINGD